MDENGAANETPQGAGTLVPSKEMPRENGTEVPAPKGYKKTKVGVIPEEWEALPARNYFDKSIEKGYSGLEIYSVTLNKSWQKRSELEREIGSDVDVDKSLLAREGYLVYNTMRMWQGALGLAESTGVVSPAYIVLKPKEMIDPKFAFYQLKSYRYLHYLKSYSYGLTSDRLRLYFNDFGMIPFICPPLKEQQKIAKILTTWDDAISKQETLIKVKKELKKGLMQKLLSGEVRFEEFDGEWEEVRLGDIGMTYGGLTGKKAEDFGIGNAKYVTYKNIFDNSKLDIELFEHVKIASAEQQNKVQYGDILFTTSSETPEEIGMSSVMLDNIDELYLNSFCFGYRVNDFEILNPNFARFYFRSFYMRDKISRLAQGSTRFNLSKLQVMKIKVKLPTQQEQQKIAQVLTMADQEIELLKEELEVLKEQKWGLMQRLLTGEVRVKIDEGETCI